MPWAATGTKATTGTTTVAIAHPTAPAAGHLLLACRAIWLNTATALNETGWTPAGDRAGANAGTAADNHSTRIRADYKVAVGGETGTVTFDQTGATGVVGQMLSFSKAVTSKDWDVLFSTGDDAAHDANRSVTLDSPLSVQNGDVLVAIAAVDTDSALAGLASPVFTGATISGINRRNNAQAVGSSVGTDGNIEVWDGTAIGSGTVTGFSFTTTTLQCGPVIVLRLREVDPVVPSSGFSGWGIPI